MLRFMARRLVSAIPVLLGLSILVFALMRLIPGDAVDSMLGNIRRPETAAQMRRLFGLDQPLHIQYLRWVDSLLHGNLGISLRTGRPVTAEILAVLPATAELAILAAIGGVAIGISCGLLSAIRQHTPFGGVVSLIGYLGIAMPEFWIGTLLILIFSIAVPLFPAGGYVDFAKDPVANLRYTFLPAATLALPFAAVVMRMTRSSTLEVLHADYVRVARAKGLRDRVVILKHVLKNSMITVLTVIGLLFGFLLGGSVVVEAIFVRPGIGRLLLIAIQQRDYAVVQGLTLFFAVVFMLSNLVVDILYGIVDPRIRYE